MYHTLHQIITPVPLKTDLQFAVNSRCFTFFTICDFSFHRQVMIQEPSGPNADRRVISNPPQEPESKKFRFNYYQTLSNAY